MSEAFPATELEICGVPRFDPSQQCATRKGEMGGFSVAGGRGTYLQGGTVATLAGVDSDDAVERRANAAEAREANLRRRVGDRLSGERS